MMSRLRKVVKMKGDRWFTMQMGLDRDFEVSRLTPVLLYNR